MTRHVLICRLFLLAGVLFGISLATIAHAGDIRMRVSQTTQDDTPPYVAVMGQVGRPGVFELSGPPPQLSEFLNLAGGITPNASGSIRLIRGGRSSQLFVSPKLNLQLIPGDLIVVESKQFVAGRQNGTTSSANSRQQNTGTLSVTPAPAIVQIGLVNLISRPIILDIPREQANLAQVLSLLHQPVADKGEITVIKPGSGVQNVTLDQAFETTLATGMVLVFDPATVNSALLPRLPNTIRAGENTETTAAGASAKSGVSQTTAPAIGLTSPAEPAGNRALLVPLVTAPETSEPRGHSADREAASIAAAPDRTATTEGSTATAQLTSAPSQSPDVQVSADTADEQRSETEAATALARPAFSVTSLFTLTGVAACCIAILLRARFKRRAIHVAEPASPEAVPQQDNSLELLISGELPMVEEPLPLPYESQIFGRPLAMSPYRTDPAQTLAGPHYVPQPSPATTEPVVVVEPVQIPVNAPAVRKVRVDRQHPRSTASVLDRALATFEGEQP